MKKTRFVVILTISLMFLVLSVGLIAPIQAQLTTETTSIFSSQAMESAMKSLSIKNTDKNTLVIESQYQKTTVEKIADSHYKITIINSTGYTTTLEMIKDQNTASILLNGQKLNPWVIGNSTLSQILPMNAPANVLSTVSQITPLLNDNVIQFQWDGIQYVSGGSGSGSIRYPHPDENYYGINIYDDWSINGNNLQHSMLNYWASVAAGELGPAGIAAIIGGVVGAAIGGPIGAAVGGVLALVYGIYLWYFTGYQVQDENLNIWYWQSLPFLNFLSDNAWYIALLGPDAVPWVAYEFVTTGYLRIGNYAFIDSLGMGEPNPPPPPPDPFYVSSVVSWTAYYYGAVNNPYALSGSSPDGSYVQLWGGNPNDGGNIVGWMNSESHGHIYLYGHSGNGYYTHLYVFVSYNDNNDWTQTSVQTVSGTNDRWIDCGSYGGNFRYIAIAAIDDNGMSANVFIDSVQVNP